MSASQIDALILFAGLPTLYVALWATMRFVVNKFPRKVFDLEPD